MVRRGDRRLLHRPRRQRPGARLVHFGRGAGTALRGARRAALATGHVAILQRPRILIQREPILLVGMQTKGCLLWRDTSTEHPSGDTSMSIRLRTSTIGFVVGAGVLLLATASRAELPVAPLKSETAVRQVAQGCSPGQWRGPGGWCRGPGYGHRPHCYRVGRNSRICE